MQTESIISTLLAAAAFLKKPAQEMVPQLLKDAYEAVKTYLRGKLRPNADAVDALDLATEKPESLIRKALLVEESASASLAGDVELARLVGQLAELLPSPGETVAQSVQVSGQSNRVQVAGRDLVVHAAKHFRRSVITPDERHITAEQRGRIRAVARELADRLAVGDGGPNFAAVHRMIQRRFGVVSYLLLPVAKFEEAMAYLTQQRAIHRSRLRRRNPTAYQNDFFRSIYARADELGWDRARVYEFASGKLGLTKPLTSLKQLGPVQLKTLVEAMQGQSCRTRS